VTVRVENTIGHSTPGEGSVIADKAVDGDVSASSLTVQEDGETWVVNWAITGPTDDVDHWNICYARGDDFDAPNMPTTCESTTDGSATTVTISKPTAAGSFTYYFTAVPVDALSNYAGAASMNEIDYFRAADNANVDDGTNTISDGGDAASSGVPGWTWGVIGGVVVVAFVAGAFILSRGDGEGGSGGEGKDWDY